jgi:hypothetical protein
MPPAPIVGSCGATAPFAPGVAFGTRGNAEASFAIENPGGAPLIYDAPCFVFSLQEDCIMRLPRQRAPPQIAVDKSKGQLKVLQAPTFQGGATYVHTPFLLYLVRLCCRFWLAPDGLRPETRGAPRTTMAGVSYGSSKRVLPLLHSRDRPRRLGQLRDEQYRLPHLSERVLCQQLQSKHVLVQGSAIPQLELHWHDRPAFHLFPRSNKRMR